MFFFRERKYAHSDRDAKKKNDTNFAERADLRSPSSPSSLPSLLTRSKSQREETLLYPAICPFDKRYLDRIGATLSDPGRGMLLSLRDSSRRASS